MAYVLNQPFRHIHLIIGDFIQYLLVYGHMVSNGMRTGQPEFGHLNQVGTAICKINIEMMLSTSQISDLP